jgi:hypothetical protein
VALMRIQQISNGYAVDENSNVHFLDANPRLDALLDLRRQIEGKCVIWCRFKEDIRIVARAINSGVTYYGDTSDADRAAAKIAFINDPHVTDFIATPATAGKGQDGLQTVCSVGIYYSNSFNAIHRWQSEDRIDRMGMIGSSRHFDLIGRGSADRGILLNLKRKRDISSLALDDLKQLMENIEC